MKRAEDHLKSSNNFKKMYYKPKFGRRHLAWIPLYMKMAALGPVKNLKLSTIFGVL